MLYKSQDWKLGYSTMRHGSSILTMARRCEFLQPAILVVRDVENHVFGAYLSHGIRMSKGSFYGNGESFLYTFRNSSEFDAYLWTGRNNYITLCDTEGLAVGCSDKYGLYLNQDLS